MNVLDIFSGTGSMSNVFKERGHDVLTIDWDKKHNPDMCDNILNISTDDILLYRGWKHIDFVHMSPDCTSYSIAAISTHRYPDGSPKSEYAKKSDEVRKHIFLLLEELNPSYFTIENPVGMFRKMPELISFSKKYYHSKITYCQYGDTRMKPTDIWHNIPTLQLKAPCHNGGNCHVRAPRGSKTGTQGLKDSVERSRIPYKLCLDICIAVEKASRDSL